MPPPAAAPERGGSRLPIRGPSRVRGGPARAALTPARWFLRAVDRGGDWPANRRTRPRRAAEPVPIPPPSDFPEVGHLTAEGVRAELAAAPDVPEPADGDYSGWDAAGFRRAIQEAAGANLGLVPFRN